MKKGVQIAFALALGILSVISTIWPEGHMESIVYAVVLPSFILSIISFVSEIAEKCEADSEKLYGLSNKCADLSKAKVETDLRTNAQGMGAEIDVEKLITPEINSELEKTNQYLSDAVGYQKTQYFFLKCKQVCDKIMVGGYVVLFLSLALSPYITQWLSGIDLNCITMWSLTLLYITLELKSDICATIFLWLSKLYIKKTKKSIEE